MFPARLANLLHQGPLHGGSKGCGFAWMGRFLETGQRIGSVSSLTTVPSLCGLLRRWSPGRRAMTATVVEANNRQSAHLIAASSACRAASASRCARTATPHLPGVLLTTRNPESRIRRRCSNLMRVRFRQARRRVLTFENGAAVRWAAARYSPEGGNGRRPP